MVLHVNVLDLNCLSPPIHPLALCLKCVGLPGKRLIVLALHQGVLGLLQLLPQVVMDLALLNAHRHLLEALKHKKTRSRV